MSARRVLIVGHADADGHLIAEQTRDSLSSIGAFDVETFVDKDATKDHKSWNQLGALGDVSPYEFVFFVDMMFSPATYVAEARALVDFARSYPTKQFIVLDHHPLPLGRLTEASNLRALYRPDVLDCVFAPASYMMIVAAMCEKEPTRAREYIPTEEVEFFDSVAKGVKRAAAQGGPLIGKKLSTLLQHDRWNDLAELGREAKEEHPLPRGRRPAGTPLSPVFAKLDDLANKLMTTPVPSKRGAQPNDSMRSIMAFDMDAPVKFRPRPTIVKSDPTDLEAIVRALQMAAIVLSARPHAEFTKKQLLEKAHELVGDALPFSDEDAEKVLRKANFIQNKPGGICVLK